MQGKHQQSRDARLRVCMQRLQNLVIVIIISIILVAHLGFVNGAVQCIVLLVIQQTEFQGSQCSCKDRERSRKLVLMAHKQSRRGREDIQLCFYLIITKKRTHFSH